MDVKTKEPLAFVNIGVLDKGLGTVSDEGGRFHLDLDASRIADNDLIQFSFLGYASQSVSVSDVPLDQEGYVDVFMEPAPMELDEAVVSSSLPVPISESVGYKNYGELIFGYWKDDKALGGEMATLIKVNEAKRQLKQLQFKVFRNLADSVLVRVNFYGPDPKNGAPGQHLNRSGKEVFQILSGKDKDVVIDLTPFDIFVHNDFFVSLELLKVHGEGQFELALAGADNHSPTYKRYVSQDKWKTLGAIPIALSLQTDVYVSQAKAQRHQKKVERVRARKRMVSGFTIHRGQMVGNVNVLNRRTGESVQSDDRGRYELHAKRNDILYFTKEGYQRLFVEIQKEDFVNAPMKKENGTSP
ncbi:carboxypeptidase-like regulatory domain-containing protein [Maribacter sp. 2307ULW6-5]|uniref:carboxypeptidase-like regulatory domain-containing protein n=1 Tax=Maribacter sp. 2307ULW6-5 TaxID=3386275 RepID=UPI0039BCB9F7